jgi:hypothetical protein
MAHFAQLDSNNVVTQIIVVGNDQLKGTVTTEVDGFLVSQTVESEAKGVEFCKTLYGADTTWKQTSYNGGFRGKYAGIGDTFDGTNFVAPEVVISTEQVQVLETVQVQALTTDQIQALTTDQISALGA